MSQHRAESFRSCSPPFSSYTAVSAQSTPKQSLLALSKKDQTLAIVDPVEPESAGAYSGGQRSA